MNAVFIVKPAGRAMLPSIWRTLSSAGYDVEQATPERLRAADSSDHVWVFLETDPSEVPEDMGDRLRAPPGQQQIAVIVIEYYALPLLKRIVSLLANDEEAVVDNDHGVSLPGPEFIRKLQAEPSWDWRIRPQVTESRD